MAWWFRLLYALIGIGILALFGSLVLVIVLSPRRGAMAVLPLLLPPLLTVPLIVLASLQRFTVTTRGVEIRTLWRRHRIAWRDVSIVDIARSVFRRGATVIRLHDGRSIRSDLTAARYSLLPGESPYDHGPRGLDPARPTRAAIAAHQQWLRESAGH